MFLSVHFGGTLRLEGIRHRFICYTSVYKNGISWYVCDFKAVLDSSTVEGMRNEKYIHLYCNLNLDL